MLTDLGARGVLGSSPNSDERDVALFGSSGLFCSAGAVTEFSEHRNGLPTDSVDTDDSNGLGIFCGGKSACRKCRLGTKDCVPVPRDELGKRSTPNIRSWNRSLPQKPGHSDPTIPMCNPRRVTTCRCDDKGHCWLAPADESKSSVKDRDTRESNIPELLPEEAFCNPSNPLCNCDGENNCRLMQTGADKVLQDPVSSTDSTHDEVRITAGERYETREVPHGDHIQQSTPSQAFTKMKRGVTSEANAATLPVSPLRDQVEHYGIRKGQPCTYMNGKCCSEAHPQFCV